jgi:O-antigen/teichoic acid export membrane protein
LTLATLETFSQTGFYQALIQRKDRSIDYLNSAWTVLIIRGFLLFLILFFLAPVASNLFKEPSSMRVIQFIGLSAFLSSFTNIGTVYFQKDLEFKKQFIFQLSGSITEFVVALNAAFLLRNVWALVLGDFAANLARILMSYRLHPFRPRFHLEKDKVKELFVFGKWVLGTLILAFLILQGGDFLVGLLLGATALGFYQMAYKISCVPATEIAQVLSQVTFPTFAKLQEKMAELKKAYIKVVELTLFLALPLSTTIFILAPDFTAFVLGQKWNPIVPAMQALCVFGVVRALNFTSQQIFNGVGKPRINTVASLVQFGFMAFLIYPLTQKWGILGTSLCIVISSLAYLLYISKKLMNEFGYTIKELLAPFVLPGFISVMILAVIQAGKLLDDLHFIWLAGLALLGLAAGVLITFILNRNFYMGFIRLIKGSFPQKSEA